MKSLLLITIGYFLLICPPAIGGTTTGEAPINSDGKSLIHYVNAIKGVWTEIDIVNEAGFNLKIDPESVTDHTVKISVGDYYLPGLVQYLHFSYKNNRLEYAGASIDDYFFDLPRIDFVYIWYEIEAGDTILMYEAREMEYENYVKVKLRKKYPSHEPANLWACSMQGHLINLFTNENLEIYDNLGMPTTAEIAFGTTALVEELRFFEDTPALWPMFEEVCVRCEFDMVIIGSFHPKGSAEIYGIEWEPDEIRLYHTYAASLDSDGKFPLQKGELAFTIYPNRILQPLIE